MSITAPSTGARVGHIAVEPDGNMRPDALARAVLGLSDAEPVDAGRFFVLAADGQAVAADRRPWSRALRGESFAEEQTWIERLSGTAAHLRAASDGTALLVSAPDTPPPMRMLASVADLLIAADDLGQVASRILGQLAHALGAESLLLLATGAAHLRVEASHGLAIETGHSIGDSSIVTRALRERGGLSLALNTLDEGWAAEWANHGLRTVDVRPLAADGQEPRVLLVARRAAAPLAEDFRKALEATCRLWANAIRQRRMDRVERRARSSMRALADTSLDARSEPPLRELLRLLVDQACKLTRARYGALGVLTPEHSALADFITVGMSETDARRIGHVPRGVGLLGAVIREGRTIRVADLSMDPRSQGFPAHHPPMTTFLGVPLRIGKEVFGNFYLTEKEDGAAFNEEDASLLEDLAAQAALTVAYARETGRQRRLLDAVLHQAPHGILFLVDAESIAFSNAAARRMLGLPEQGPAKRTYQLLRPDGQPLPPDEEPAARALAGDTLEHVEVQIVRATRGEPLPVFASAAPVLSETGQLLGAVVALQDLTPFKALEKMREEFSAVVAHDLRSPLGSIMLQIETLLRRADQGMVHAPASAIERMRHSGQRLEQLINDLLDAARIESGRVHLDLRPVLLDQLTTRLAQQLAPTLAPHSVCVRVDGSPGPVSADPMRIEQVLTNLIENAGKYSAPGAPIEICVAPDGAGVRVSVQDRGPGIASEDIPRLFERYYQGGRAREKRSGLGLGLFIAKGLIDAHQGRLGVESTLGAGSTFSIWLPTAVPAPPSPAAAG